MTAGRGTPRDLALLVADADMREGFTALLGRHRALGIRLISFDIFRHDERDAGCFTRAHEYLRPLARRYEHALVVFDKEGCGSPDTVPAIEADVRERLERSGWAHRADVVVIDPELEVWVWSPSPAVATSLGWTPAAPLRRWLDLLPSGQLPMGWVQS